MFVTVTYLQDNSRHGIQFPKSSNYIHGGPSSEVLGYYNSKSGPANGLSVRTGNAGEKYVLGYGRVVFVMYLSVKGFFLWEEGRSYARLRDVYPFAVLLNRVYFVETVEI